jgi:transcriptional regulator with XRE-family HTH domain
MNDNLHFGERLKFYMKSKRIQSLFLSEKLGVAHTVINSYYKASEPRRETKAKILAALGITEEQLYAFRGENVVEEAPAKYEIIEQEQQEQEQEVKMSMSDFQFLMQQAKKVNELNEEIIRLKNEKIKELEEVNRAKAHTR